METSYALLTIFSKYSFIGYSKLELLDKTYTYFFLFMKLSKVEPTANKTLIEGIAEDNGLDIIKGSDFMRGNK